MSLLDVLHRCEGFEWDEANVSHIAERHDVRAVECEQALLNRPLVVADDRAHSQNESRYYALGRTDDGRHLFVVMTVKGSFLRVVTARDMSRRERKEYRDVE
ncbi:MAG: uncharacterized DUF497 family protein [Hyphomicrobiaceae bacterium]